MIHLTVDQDWAPEWATLEVHEVVRRAGIRATFFVTHDCPSLKVLRDSGLWELAIHPNFPPGAKRKERWELIQRLRSIVPEAVGVRAHGLLRSTAIWNEYVEAGLLYDSSDLMDGQDHLRPMETWNGLVRLPIFWSDDVALRYGRPSGVDLAGVPKGMRIYVFHPVLIALDALTLGPYEALKRALSGRGVKMPRATRDEVSALRNHGGVGTSFDDLLDSRTVFPSQFGGTLECLLAGNGTP